MNPRQLCLSLIVAVAPVNIVASAQSPTVPGSGDDEKGHIKLEVMPSNILFPGTDATLTATIEHPNKDAEETVEITIPDSTSNGVQDQTTNGKLTLDWTPKAADGGDKEAKTQVITNSGDYEPYRDSLELTVVPRQIKLEADPLVVCQQNGTTTLTATLRPEENGGPEGDATVTFSRLPNPWSKDKMTTNGATKESPAFPSVGKYKFTASIGEATSENSNAVDVYAGEASIPDDETWPKNNKLLIGASHKVSGQVNPYGADYHWSYDQGGSFVKNGTPNANKPKFTAPEMATDAEGKDKDNVTLKFGYKSSVATNCGDERPLNITRPLNAELPQGEPSIVPTQQSGEATKTVDVSADDFEIIKQGVKYTIFDQFDDGITKSDAGNKKVQIKETLVFKSPKPDLQKWLRQEVKTGERKWQDPGTKGQIRDNLKIQDVPTDTVKGLPKVYKGMKLVQIKSHKWYVFVNGKHEKLVTDNVFTATVQDVNTKAGTFDIKVKYEVKLQDN